MKYILAFICVVLIGGLVLLSLVDVPPSISAQEISLPLDTENPNNNHAT